MLITLTQAMWAKLFCVVLMMWFKDVVWIILSFLICYGLMYPNKFLSMNIYLDALEGFIYSS